MIAPQPEVIRTVVAPQPEVIKGHVGGGGGRTCCCMDCGSATARCDQGPCGGVAGTIIVA